MGLAQETARVVNMFDDFHTNDEIESFWFEESFEAGGGIRQSNIEALTSRQGDCSLGTLEAAEFPGSKLADFAQDGAVTAANIENRAFGWY